MSDLKLSPRLQSYTISAVRGLDAAIKALDIEGGELLLAVHNYEEHDGPAPDILARAIAFILLTDNVGFPSDGVFTITRADGVEDGVAYPITFAGLTNALNELQSGDTLGFRAGPDGPYATATAQAKDFLETLIASNKIGQPPSDARN